MKPWMIKRLQQDRARREQQQRVPLHIRAPRPDSRPPAPPSEPEDGQERGVWIFEM